MPPPIIGNPRGRSKMGPLSTHVLKLNLSELKGLFPLQLVGHIVLAVLPMIVSPILAWVAFVHKFLHRAELYVIARGVERDN